jgi:hypothetical protein
MLSIDLGHPETYGFCLYGQDEFASVVTVDVSSATSSSPYSLYQQNRHEPSSPSSSVNGDILAI